MKNKFYDFGKWKTLTQCLILSLLLFSSQALVAQLNEGGVPKSFGSTVKANIDSKVMPPIDLAKLEAEDRINDTKKMPYRIASTEKVSYGLNTSGTWEDLNNGDRLWRLEINCPDAKGITLLYDDFHMPPGAQLYLYNEDKSQVLGAFTERNNKSHRKFATALTRGSFVTIEYYEPSNVKNQGALNISQVGHVYRGIGENNAQLGNSGNCQVDVNCSPEGDNWQDEKKGVAKILINGSGLCTGSLINNVERDCRPLFLTADHCLGNVDAIANPNAPGWVFYWNFERTGCANLLDPVDDSQTTTGAVLLANAGQEINNDPASEASDFALFELSENPSDAYDVYFNGFDASGATGTGGVGIHHPGGDAKKIATHNLTPTSVVNNNYWRILPWLATANGQSVTEGGSSGSPLFNSTGNIIGQLFGGFQGGQPNCTDPDADEGDYGRLDVSWNFGATATRRLRDHLDPNNTGTTIVAGASGNTQCCQLVVNCALITDQTLSCRADLPPVDFNLPIITESCGDVTLSALTIIPGNSGCPGDEVSITRTYFIQDDEGNMAECMQTFTVISNVLPTIVCPAGGVVECATDISVSPNDAVVTSECGTPVTSVSGPVINGTPDCPFTTYTYTYTVTDDCGRTASCPQVFTIQNAEPTIVCPADMFVECAADIVVNPANAVVTTSCTLGFNTIVSGPVIIGQPDCPGTMYMYTYTTTDDCGRTAECKQVFTIQNTGPTITCPADIIVSCEDEINLDPNDAVVTTFCGLGFTVYIKQPLQVGATGCNGTVYTYIYKVVDECGQVAKCEQQVLIQNTPASINVPAGGVVECFEDIDISVNDATVNNACAEFNLYLDAPTITGEQGCPGTTYTFTYRLLDVCGNNIEEDVVFTNGNNAPPMIEAPLDITCECLAGVNANPDNAFVTTSCDAGYEVTVTGPTINGNVVDCPGTQYVYTYTVTDDCGRTASDQQVFTVQNGPPTISGCNPDEWLQFNCEDYGGEDGTIAAIEAYIASVTATSSCGLDLFVFNNFNSNNINTCINSGINTIRFLAVDFCGRQTVCEQTYVVVDTEAPDIIVEAEDHWEICNYNSPANFQAWVDDNGGAEAYDGCSNDNVAWYTIPSNPTFNCMGAAGITSVTVTFGVVDNCGNTSTTTATFNAFMGGNDMIGQDDDLTLENERAVRDGVVVFPNPADTKVHIDLKEYVNRSAVVRIYNALGRLEATKVIDQVGTTPYQFDLSNYSSGTYVMSIDIDGTKRIAKTFMITGLNDFKR